MMALQWISVNVGLVKSIGRFWLQLQKILVNIGFAKKNGYEPMRWPLDITKGWQGLKVAIQVEKYKNYVSQAKKVV